LGAGEYVQIRINGGNWLDATVTGNGLTWVFDNQANDLPEGSYQIETRTVDTAGNEMVGNSQTIIIDLTANMTASVSITGYDDDVEPGLGTDLASGSYSNDGQPLLKGVSSGVDVAGGDRISVRQGGVHIGYAVIEMAATHLPRLLLTVPIMRVQPRMVLSFILTRVRRLTRLICRFWICMMM